MSVEEINRDLVAGMRMLTEALASISRRLPETDGSVQERFADLEEQRNIAIQARLGQEEKVRELEAELSRVLDSLHSAREMGRQFKTERDEARADLAYKKQLGDLF